MTSRIATGVILRWVDPDTLVCGELDLGWGVALRDDPRRQTTHVRLAGINAPDTKANAPWVDPVLKQAGTDYVNTTWPSGTAITLTSYELDNFGRSIAKVEAAGVDIGVALVSLGYARLGDYAPPVAEG